MPRRTFEEKDGQLEEKVDPITVGAALGLDLQLLAKAQGPLSLSDVVQFVGKAGDLRAFSELVPTNPGIEITVVGLAYDLARAEELRLEAEVDSARRRLALHDRHLAFLEQHQGTTEQAKITLASVIAIQGINDNMSVRDTLERLRSKAKRAESGKQARGNLSAAYSALAQYAKTILAEQPVRENFDGEVSKIQVDQELVRADIALREREAVIVRGLEGLVAFHEGGIDAEDVRNIIGVAQAVGIFAIAAK